MIVLHPFPSSGMDGGEHSMVREPRQQPFPILGNGWSREVAAADEAEPAVIPVSGNNTSLLAIQGRGITITETSGFRVRNDKSASRVCSVIKNKEEYAAVSHTQ